MKEPHKAFETLFILSEIVLIIGFLFMTDYADLVDPKHDVPDSAAGKVHMSRYYPFFQDVHVMIFIGFGFLMVFLKTHSWTSVGFNFIIAAYALQLTILVQGAWHNILVSEDGWHKVELGIPTLITGDFGAGAVLITFGAVLGKVSIFQMWVLATIEIVFYALNEVICVNMIQAVDMGGSMYVHTFGAYFGVAAAYFFNPYKAKKDEHDRCGGNYNSQLIAMVGTIFLWMYWPSFNGALAEGSQQQRVVVNTVLAISASCVSAIGVSRMVLQKLDMEVLLNATLAGGVAIGSASDLVVSGGVSMLIGTLGGIVSAFGFLRLNKFLQDNINLHDTCGVHNLHGLPGIMGAVFGAIAASMAETTHSQDSIENTFAAVGEGRTLSEQGWMQLAALGTTLAISILSGILGGFIASKCCNPDKFYDDQEHFHECEYEEEKVVEELVVMPAPNTDRTDKAGHNMH